MPRLRTKPYPCGYPCDHLIDPADPPELSTISYGGGVQSTALLVLAAERKIPFDTFLMSNVGDDSEHPATLTYVREIAAPYAAANGITLQMLERRRRDGTPETLMGRLMKPGSRSLPIPVRMSNGAPGNRSCTADFKIRVVGRWLKAHGATAAHPATVGIGISLDEIQRANTRTKDEWERVVYPLIGIGIDTGLKMRRQDCDQLIRRAGLPVPPKSSCFFCPFHKPAAWSDLHRDRPDLFDRAVELEDTLNERRTTLGKDPVFLTRFGIPLRDAIDTDQELLPLAGADGACDSGWCFT
jgi:hypothetical protein